MVSCKVHALFLFVIFCVYALKGLLDLFLDFINFQIVIFDFCIHLYTLYFAHILPTPSLSINNMTAVVMVNIIMSSYIVRIRYGKRCNP